MGVFQGVIETSTDVVISECYWHEAHRYMYVCVCIYIYRRVWEVWSIINCKQRREKHSSRGMEVPEVPPLQTCCGL